ncbi:MAG: nickel-dependent hydrogenase large subunit [Thermodesulfovibrionales bacterium]
MSIIGGRSIHPLNVRVGGFYRAPELKRLTELLPSLEKAFEDTIKEIKWASGLNFREVCQEREYVSLRDEMEYPMNYGSVVSNKGLNVTMEDYLEAIEEYQKGYSTALFSGIKRKGEPQPYLVGPLARLNHNYDKLPDEIRGVMKEYGIEIPLLGMDKGIIARVIEIAYAIYESIRLIKGLNEAESPSIEFEPRAGIATWITEAPRGILIHKYELDEKGRIMNCKIIPPTSQNLAMIEQDIINLVMSETDIDKGLLKKAVASLIRSYDPCISCSVHLL